LTRESCIRLLDVGCGSGGFLRFVSKNKRIHPMGIDLISHWRAIWRKYDVPAEVLRIEDVVNRDDQYDVVTCTEVLEHILNPVSFFNNLTKIVQPGGALILTFPNIGVLSPFCLGQTSAQAWPPNHINFPTKKTIEILGNRFGVRLVAWQTVGGEVFSWRRFAQRFSYVTDWCSGFYSGKGYSTVRIPKRVWKRGASEKVQYTQEVLLPDLSGTRVKPEVLRKYDRRQAILTKLLLWMWEHKGFGCWRFEKHCQAKDGRLQALVHLKRDR